jgi:DNA segregation ATPase FtsK/SpoIIIE-like protein
VHEMETPCNIFARAGVRNITEFNARPKTQVPGGDDVRTWVRLAYIVVIINELADLMHTAPTDVESAIARITQMTRTTGIHIIAATRSPLAEVLTGLIKANIPTRIAFQVVSAPDSRMILDERSRTSTRTGGHVLPPDRYFKAYPLSGLACDGRRDSALGRVYFR